MLTLTTRPRLLVLSIAVLGLAWSADPGARPAQSATSVRAPDSLILQGKTIFKAALNNGSRDSLKQAQSLFKKATDASDRPALAHYYAALAAYRLNNQLPRDAEDERESLIEDAIDHLETATEIDPEMADAWALLTGCYGQMMGMNPLSAMSLSSDAEEAMEKAQSLEPENPRVWIISGTQDFFTPSMFGGDKERALEKFAKAARLAEQERTSDPLAPSWGHAEAHAWIGIAHMNADRFDAARDAFQKSLDVNPEFAWVKQSLLPELEEKTE